MVEIDSQERPSPSPNSFREVLEINGLEFGRNTLVEEEVRTLSSDYLRMLAKADQHLAITTQKTEVCLSVINDPVILNTEGEAESLKNFVTGFYDMGFAAVVQMVNEEKSISEETKQEFLTNTYLQVAAQKDFTEAVLENGMMIVFQMDQVPLMGQAYPLVNPRKTLFVNEQKAGFPSTGSPEFKAAVREEVIHLMDTSDRHYPQLARGWMRETLAKVYLVDGVDGVRNWDIPDEEKEKVMEYCGYPRHATLYHFVKEQGQLTDEELYATYFGNGDVSQETIRKIQTFVDEWDIYCRAISYGGKDALNSVFKKEET